MGRECSGQRWRSLRFVQLLPFTGIAEQARITFVKVTRAEGLQRVLLGHGLKQVMARLKVPATGKVIAQLANQNAGRALAVVANTAPYPTDIKLLAGRQQRLKQ